jgi:type IV secretory pathway VirJ component
VVQFNGRAPVWEQPTAAPSKIMTVWYSGDGGWGHVDKAVIPMLAAHGIPSVEVNSRSYFWRRRTLDEAVRDLDGIISAYSARWGADQVVLVGYSFGGGAVPLMAPHLSAANRAKIREIILLAPVDKAQLVVRPWTWMGLDQPEAVPIAQLVRASPAPVVCIYGGLDHIAACRDLHRTPKVWLEAGHLFDGKHEEVADAILHSIDPSSPAPPFTPLEP